jgi:hypothetical protein
MADCEPRQGLERQGMQSCPICEHSQREAIDHDLHANIALAVLAVRYRARKAVLEIHAGHVVQAMPVTQRIPARETRQDLPIAETPMSLLKQGLPYVHEAMRLAGADRIQQQQIIDRLNETVMAALSHEEMGLG